MAACGIRHHAELRCEGDGVNSRSRGTAEPYLSRLRVAVIWAGRCSGTDECGGLREDLSWAKHWLYEQRRACHRGDRGTHYREYGL